VHDLEKNRQDFIMQQKVTAEPFLFDQKSSAEPTVFQVFFRTEEYEYRYYLALQKDEIAAENLDRKKTGEKNAAHIFGRRGKEIDLGSALKKENVNTNVNP